MNFLLDQSADARLAPWLTAQGHDAVRIGRDYPHGLPDEEVLAIARREGRILITNDRDFGELVFKRGHLHTGVIYLRLPTYHLPTVQEAVARVLSEHAQELDQFLVVTPRGVRVRRSRPR